ncbi:MAG: DUF58 domain-containing protein [Fimbriimonadaceae bacterium]|nr:MAG: DUF58 domain-containing protein [Fimbriimonadaceae bacterium]
MLERLRLNPRKSFGGRVRGERLSREKGISLEFKDYRDYSDGDDLRHIDWNVLARLGQPIIKTYQDEEDLPLTLLVDCSLSMDYGEPNKLQAARRFVAAFGAMAMRGGDSVQAISLTDSPTRTRNLRGRKGLVSLGAWCESLSATGKLGVGAHLRQQAKSMNRLGLVVLLTDGMDPEVTRGISQLTSTGHEVWVVQILSPFELDPALEGDLRLIDAESGAAVEITANSPTLTAYAKNLAEHNRMVESACAKYGGRYALVSSADSLSKVITDTFKKKGWVV